MITSFLIDQWVSRHVITEEQARIMRIDISESKKERSSINIIVALSTMGAIVLGLGVIMFVASNWQHIGAFSKVLFLMVGTVGISTLGYLFTYEYKNYINVGKSLVFLGSLLYCATIFLVAQIYHINAHNHWLILLCLIGIAPLVYITYEKVFTVLLSIGFYIWLGFVALRSFDFGEVDEVVIGIPVLLLTASIGLFYLGGFHYLIGRFSSIARIYRLFAIAIGGLVLLILTFEGITGDVEYFDLSRETIRAFGQLTVSTLIIAGMSGIAGFVYFFRNPSKSQTVMWETAIPVAILVISSMYLLFPRTTDVFTYLFNILYIGLTLVVLLVGYKREDMRLVNNGVFFTSIYIVVRYFDLFWDLFDRSIFFMLGGILLVGGGFILESQRRKLKKQFTSSDHE
ncbi:MAG: hypothetical protein UU81_C0015G0003 [Microgenomates group bacterium GW2011_GWC1_41_8]|uniref:DUF2157 domain-containing protein n=3 Tax=Candidatus Roizmaniibacteriota TaxID=1752723 RepID=A0A0G0ZGK0_9BACT|nr:MAG: hypothetical protein UU14_C0002G0055 [Candidatus Roizmanbacteria bacterium GW2011_GWB1_40_7]KKR94188.1 MAG: hypothetical protein UU41_C0011G0015 [Candidatus Roizmanbacteria bacterium GW2011_GWA1_41_13]KKS21151.1 MAG: hypothetical protein UU78_C0043G0009 [Candidatus Roizmanbacteria bacterium GW2011_GWC2_41_7]KKS23943.1 MAG: hypothetical protein UU81_C0015G0003 [Microgenomates group bacterium GW2011_GWC1_41_8]OGK49694.1 MAG: hypothetical protein A3A55_02770 [Candidatus Roizmanbacteria bac